MSATILAATAFIPATAASAAPSAPYDVFTIDGWEMGVYEPSAYTFSLQNFTDAFQIKAVGASGFPDSAWVNVAAPTGTHLSTGTFAIADQPDATHAGFGFTIGSSGASYCSGSLTISEVTLDEANANAVTAFAGSYAVTCGTRPKEAGEIRYHSSVGYKSTLADHNEKYWQNIQVGEDSAVENITVKAWGSNSSSLGTTTLTGNNPGVFTIVSDTCSGASLAYGQTCVVGVKAHPTTANGQNAVLTIPDDSALGGHKITLGVSGVDMGQGTYVPVTPSRILDTRNGNGATKARVGKGGVVHLQVLGRGGIPSSGVSAVVLNLTVTGPSASGFLTAFPGGTTRPTASSLNFRAGETRSNSVTVQVGGNGKIDIYNYQGSVDIIADVTGWYKLDSSAVYYNGGQFQPFSPFRLFDSRTDWGTPLPADSYAQLALDFGSYNDHVRAFVVNITAVNPAADGFLTAWNGDSNFPTASTVNYTRGSVTPNFAVVPVGPCYLCTGSYYGKPSISIYSLRKTHLIVDVVGIYDDGTISDGLRFTPRSPQRIVDSRSGYGLPHNLSHGGWTVTNTAGVIEHADTWALATNLTGAAPTAATYLTIWPNGIAKPTVSNLNLVAGQTAANAAVTLLGPDNDFNVYNNAGTTAVIVDVVGSFWLYEGTASGTASTGAGLRGGATKLNPVGRAAVGAQL